MTLTELRDIFDTISKPAFKRDGYNDPIIVGKYCVISPKENGLYDVWIVHRDYQQGETLSNQKVTYILKALPNTFRQLTGEAIGVMTEEQIKQSLKVLGLRKRYPARRLYKYL